jgi:hypothetical protein
MKREMSALWNQAVHTDREVTANRPDIIINKDETKERCHGKRMHGQLPRRLYEKLLDIEQSYRWLKYGDIKGETESTIVALKTKQLVQTILRIKI